MSKSIHRWSKQALTSVQVPVSFFKIIFLYPLRKQKSISIAWLLEKNITKELFSPMSYVIFDYTSSNWMECISCGTYLCLPTLGLFRTGAEIGSFLLTLPGFSAETGVTLAAGGQERVDEKYAVSVLCKLNGVSANNTNHASVTSQPLLDVPR